MANGYRESGILHPLQQPKISYSTCRIIPLSKYLVTPIYKPFRPFIRGITPFRGLTITMVINHLLTGMILQVPPFHGPVSFPLPKRVSGFKEGEAWEKIFQFWGKLGSLGRVCRVVFGVALGWFQQICKFFGWFFKSGVCHNPLKQP